MTSIRPLDDCLLTDFHLIPSLSRQGHPTVAHRFNGGNGSVASP